MKLGAITNSWREHLESASIESLVAQAAERGAMHIELRQTCLGDCETGEGNDWQPNIANLKRWWRGIPVCRSTWRWRIRACRRRRSRSRRCSKRCWTLPCCVAGCATPANGGPVAVRFAVGDAG